MRARRETANYLRARAVSSSESGHDFAARTYRSAASRHHRSMEWILSAAMVRITRT